MMHTPATTLVAAPLARPHFPTRGEVAAARAPSRRSGRTRAARRVLDNAPRATRPPGPRNARSTVLSMAAMLFACALLVGVSVPASAFRTNASDATAALAASGTEKADPQSMDVDGDAVVSAPVRDSYSVTSYAQMLAAKYASIDYSYSATTGAVRWPFPYSVSVTSGFGEREGGFHKGVDFVPGGGAPIYAVADGVATYAAEDYSGYGNHVVISHLINGQKVESLSAHMISGSSPIVAGQEIKVGDFLGLVGDTGISYGAHLHFEIHLDGVPVDPFAWLQANTVN